MHPTLILPFSCHILPFSCHTLPFSCHTLPLSCHILPLSSLSCYTLPFSLQTPFPSRHSTRMTHLVLTVCPLHRIPQHHQHLRRGTHGQESWYHYVRVQEVGRSTFPGQKRRIFKQCFSIEKIQIMFFLLCHCFEGVVPPPVEAVGLPSHTPYHQRVLTHQFVQRGRTAFLSSCNKNITMSAK